MGTLDQPPVGARNMQDLIWGKDVAIKVIPKAKRLGHIDAVLSAILLESDFSFCMLKALLCSVGIVCDHVRTVENGSFSHLHNDSRPYYNSASLPSMPPKVSGMSADSYVHIVQAQVDMAFERFDSAVALAEKTWLIDRVNSEVEVILNNGKDLSKAGKFAEASVAYGEGLKYEPSNPELYLLIVRSSHLALLCYCIL
ncbi:unnamed protein product [Miscanthus lutarioriparius]|uniref:Uncharacterized protein n=1 Tax=Miscanthus lutarioriparius TaxID=422564 RepID=A0A811SG87_9POAL|nr:unnamed protein product [Miscanthus lutarioriparius]